MTRAWDEWYPVLLHVPQFADYPTPWAALSAILSDPSFVCPTRRTARWATAAGMPAFAYVNIANSHEAKFTRTSGCRVGG